MNLYDFDKTIYDGDSTIDFYLFCLFSKISIIKYLPKQIFAFIKYKLKKINKDKFKEQFFMFLKSFNNIDDVINKFWIKNKNKIKKWYLEKEHSKDIIISASPLFLLKPMKKELNVYDIIATEVDKKTGEFLSKNCYGKEKVNRLLAKYKKIKIINTYTDSLSDKPILDLANNGYIVKKEKIIKYKGE